MSSLYCASRQWPVATFTAPTNGSTRIVRNVFVIKESHYEERQSERQEPAFFSASQSRYGRRYRWRCGPGRTQPIRTNFAVNVGAKLDLRIFRAAYDRRRCNPQVPGGSGADRVRPLDAICGIGGYRRRSTDGGRPERTVEPLSDGPVEPRYRRPAIYRQQHAG